MILAMTAVENVSNAGHNPGPWVLSAARSMLEEAVKLDPSNQQAKMNLNLLKGI
jgi:hypothetical protein